MNVFNKDKAFDICVDRKYGLADLSMIKGIIDAHIADSSNPDQQVKVFGNKKEKSFLFMFQEMNDDDWTKLVADLRNYTLLKKQLIDGGHLK